MHVSPSTDVENAVSTNMWIKMVEDSIGFFL